MFKKYYPGAYADSVFAIDYQKLYQKGFRAIIFDIDNTLVHHGADADQNVILLFQKLHRLGFQTILLSNNDKARVSRFVREINTPYICDAQKPQPQGYQQALRTLGTTEKETIVIGDQMFVDIVGANRCGIPSILVHYISVPGEKWIGFRRYLEKAILLCFQYHQRSHKCSMHIHQNTKQRPQKRKLFCEISPLTYAISEKKNILKRHLQNHRSDIRFAKAVSNQKLPYLISKCSSHLIKKGKGIDPITQQNKAQNIRIAAKQIHGIVIRPGETFSFWNRVGNTTPQKGYREGRVLILGKLTTGFGGGLCNLANPIHRTVLESPLTVTEFHMHSDALAPDENGIRVPMSAGTSVSYNYVDYRFRNDTDEDIQLLVQCDAENLFCELRSTNPFPNRYEISEEDHHFSFENGKYYRNSRIYQDTYDKKTNERIAHKLILNNHSEVLFDPALLPSELIRSIGKYDKKTE